MREKETFWTQYGVIWREGRGQKWDLEEDGFDNMNRTILCYGGFPKPGVICWGSESRWIESS